MSRVSAELRPRLEAEYVADTVHRLEARIRARFPDRRLRNVAAEPRLHFDCDVERRPLLLEGRILAMLHSHPDDPDHPAPRGDLQFYGPSAHDIAQQQADGVPWGICLTDGDHVTVPFFWGDGVPVPPLLARPFRHRRLPLGDRRANYLYFVRWDGHVWDGHVRVHRIGPGSARAITADVLTGYLARAGVPAPPWQPPPSASGMLGG